MRTVRLGLLAFVVGGCGLVLDLGPSGTDDAGSPRMDASSRDGSMRRDGASAEGDAGKPCVTSDDCEDGLRCNGVATCVGGYCGAASAPVCDDGIDCTDDTCDETVGCVSTPRHDLCPTDGLGCTIERCDPIVGCAIDLSDAACDDGIACTIDACDPVADCTHTPDDSRCGGTATCSAGVGCVGEECDVGGDCAFLLGPCHDGVACMAGACVFTNAADGMECVDANPCAVPGTATCIAGECRGTRTLTCAGMPCFQCNLAGAGCDGSIVRTGSCTDADPCTAGTSCQPDGSCGGGAATMCVAPGPCTSATCDGAGGCAYAPLPDGTPCPTGTCRSGTCTVSALCRSDQVMCDDGSCCPRGCANCIAGGGCDYCGTDEFNCVSGGNVCVSRSFPATSCPGDPPPSLCGCRCNPDIGETCCEAGGSGTCCPAGDPTCCM